MREKRRTGSGLPAVVAVVACAAGLALPCHAQTPDSTPAVGVRITGIGQITIPVSDLDRAVVFYTEKLGLELWTAGEATGVPGSLALVIPGSRTRVVLVSNPRLVSGEEVEPADRGRLITFETGDLDATYEKLADRGVWFDSIPRDRVEERSATFRDPDGNLLALAETVGAAVALESGVWSGTMTNLGGVSSQLLAVVSNDDDYLRIKLIVHGVEFRLLRARYDGSVIGFNWRPGSSIDCTLYRQMDGSFAGTCVDQADGTLQMMTMVPPDRR